MSPRAGIKGSGIFAEETRGRCLGKKVLRLHGNHSHVLREIIECKLNCQRKTNYLTLRPECGVEINREPCKHELE